MREQFEKLPEISEILNRNQFLFNEDKNQYYIIGFASDTQKVCDVNFIGGAWYAFQEQQKKIDDVKDLMDKIQSETEGDEGLLCDYLGEIEELLK